MSSLYQRSQEDILAADQAQREGRFCEAQALYLRAAELQRAMVAALPAERVRTRSVYSRSAAALEEKAQMADVLNMRPWALEQGAHDIQVVRRVGASVSDFVICCAPCRWTRSWSGLDLLQRAPEALEDEMKAAILEHIKPLPLTLDEMRDLGWFEEEA